MDTSAIGASERSVPVRPGPGAEASASGDVGSRGVVAGSILVPLPALDLEGGIAGRRGVDRGDVLARVGVGRGEVLRLIEEEVRNAELVRVERRSDSPSALRADLAAQGARFARDQADQRERVEQAEARRAAEARDATPRDTSARGSTEPVRGEGLPDDARARAEVATENASAAFVRVEPEARRLVAAVVSSAGDGEGPERVRQEVRANPDEAVDAVRSGGPYEPDRLVSLLG